MKIVRESFIIIGITFLMLVLLEFGLRVIFPEKVTDKVGAKNLAYEHNTRYIISLKPNVKKTYKRRKVNGGEKITWATNSNGFRGPEFNGKNDVRIIVYGDSNVQARFSSYVDTYPKLLQDYLSAHDSTAQVINAGLVGAGPDQNLLRMIDDVKRLQPDMVILHIFADNDYGDIIRNRLFETDSDGKLIKTSFPITQDSIFAPLDTGILGFVNALLITRAVNKLVSSNDDDLSEEAKVKKRLSQLQAKAKKEFEIYKSRLPREISHFDDHYDIDLATEPRGESAMLKIMLMKMVLREAKDVAKKSGIRLLVMIQPAAADLTENNTNIGFRDLQSFEHYKRTNLTHPLLEICGSLKLHCIHLIDSFMANNPDNLYLKDDNHWNNKGQKLAAKITADYILNNSMLEK